jgi:hypothetical protein
MEQQVVCLLPIINNKVISSANDFELFVYILLKQPKFSIAIKKEVNRSYLQTPILNG